MTPFPIAVAASSISNPIFIALMKGRVTPKLRRENHVWLLRYLYRSGLVCSRGYWSCDSLTGLPILQTHRLGLACSRDYWSCSPRLLTELPVKLTSWSCLLKELLVLQLCSQDYLSCNSQARSCLLKGLLVLQPSAAHRFTCLVNSRRGLAAQGITGLAALSSLTGLPILQTHGLAARLAH